MAFAPSGYATPPPGGCHQSGCLTPPIYGASGAAQAAYSVFTPPPPAAVGAVASASVALAPAAGPCTYGAPGGETTRGLGGVFHPHLPGFLRRKRREVTAPIGGKLRQRAFEVPGQVRMLVISLDYKGTSNPLTCTIDGNNMVELARASGVADITQVYDGQATKDNVLHAVRTIARRCAPNDYFFLYYSGHGTSIRDMDGDEVDGEDEAYVLCDSRTGQAIPPTEESLLSDDELAAMLCRELKQSVKVIVISDCCHSGSICDFKKESWRGRRAVSISGCRDTQTSGDTGNGGICTHALLLAVEQLQKKSLQSYNLGRLFRETIMIDDAVFQSPQDITIGCAPGVSQSDMMWPLVPKSTYVAPYQGHHPTIQSAPQAPATAVHHYPAHTAYPSQPFQPAGYHTPPAPAPYVSPPPMLGYYVQPSYVPSTSYVPSVQHQPLVSGPSFLSHVPSVATTAPALFTVENPVPQLFAQSFLQPAALYA
eukprot:TRINITY_DN37327_c0_g1_i1.p1 TRINITY_DN37327_c0_g1~~TRINITY_DN37327_c0_g1_i1.p1  ORF type:complete len:482 (+),score=74.44 TRINITY_DN37327_c0_g1_i1:72-1517(+)